MIAALYVQRDGVYYGLPEVDPWDVERDARLYAGPWPVVAHPPCERWGRYWSGGPNPRAARRKLGDDGGCFQAALAAVRRWGGVLEHPEASHAWHAFNLRKPKRSGGWIRADAFGGWTCCIEQGNYGHSARKATWLYAFGCLPPLVLKWGAARDRVRIDEGFNSKEQAKIKRNLPDFIPCKRLSFAERVNTPIAFRNLLISIAESVRL